jgi:hypothetical protein
MQNTYRNTPNTYTLKPTYRSFVSFSRIKYPTYFRSARIFVVHSEYDNWWSWLFDSRTSPLRITQLFYSTLDLFNSDTFNFQTIQLPNDSTSGQFNFRTIQLPDNSTSGQFNFRTIQLPDNSTSGQFNFRTIQLPDNSTSNNSTPSSLNDNESLNTR